MLKKARELIEDERAKHEGRYHDAGVWCALNWVLEEADRVAEREVTNTLSAVVKEKSFVIEELGKAKEECRHVREKQLGINFAIEDKVFMVDVDAYGKDSTKATFYTGVLEGLDIAIEILKEIELADAMTMEER